MRSFEYAGYLRVIGTDSEVQRVGLLADLLDVPKRMTHEIRDSPEFDSKYHEIATVFLLAGILEVLTGGVDESGNIRLAIPCTWMYWKYYCLQQY